MNPDELWAAIDTQRLRTADLLSELTPGEWDTPSLCEGWTVRDVAAHLTLQQMTLGSALLAPLRHPGGLNHIINASARDRAARPPDRLIAEIRGIGPGASSLGQRLSSSSRRRKNQSSTRFGGSRRQHSP